MSTIEAPKSLMVYLPKEINLDELLRKDPISLGIQAAKYDKARDMIALILGQIVFRMRMSDTPTDYQTLNARVLQNLCRHYRHILAWAQNIGLIECKRQYIKGQSSRSYKFRKAPIKFTPYYVTDKVLLKNSSRDYRKFIKKRSQLYAFLKSISIDEEMALSLIAEMDCIDLKKEMYRLSVHALKSQKYHYSIDRVGRLHTNVTNLKKELRSALRYDGNSLVNVDIKNSQPYFAIALMTKLGYENLGIERLLNKHSQHMTPNLIQKIEEKRDQDHSQYIDDVRSGEFYERIQSELGNNRTRDEVKKFILSMMYTPSNYKCRDRPLFTSMYPQFAELIDLINTGYRKIKSKGRTSDEQSCTLAYVLQEVESTVIYDYIVPRIYREYPTLPVWTIHDSVMTIDGYEDVVATIISEECTKLLGMSPVLSVE